MIYFRASWLVMACLLSLSFGCVGEATPQPTHLQPKSFKECVTAGGAILKSYPAQCVTPEGFRFVEEESAHKGKPDRGCRDLCGNGNCEEVVCMAVGCPCAESHSRCPVDCKE
jgi:hypothetical protein